jgi:hypothetical protein
MISYIQYNCLDSDYIECMKSWLTLFRLLDYIECMKLWLTLFRLLDYIECMKLWLTLFRLFDYIECMKSWLTLLFNIIQAIRAFTANMSHQFNKTRQQQNKHLSNNDNTNFSCLYIYRYMDISS